MKINSLLESSTVASDTANSTNSAPKFGRSDKFLEEKDETVEESTTSGSVASVDSPIGGMQRRGKGSMFAGIKTSAKYPNSKAVKEGKNSELDSLYDQYDELDYDGNSESDKEKMRHIQQKIKDLKAKEKTVNESQLNEVDPRNFDSDEDYYRARNAPARQRSAPSSYPYSQQDDDAYFREIFRKKRIAAQQQERSDDHDRLATGTNESEMEEGQKWPDNSNSLAKRKPVVAFNNQGVRAGRPGGMTVSTRVEPTITSTSVQRKDDRPIPSFLQKEGEEMGTFAALKDWQVWDVRVFNNFYRGKYADYGPRLYSVVASSPEEARQVVINNPDYVLQDLLSRKLQSGKRVLPRGSALPVEEKRVGQAEPGSITTMGLKKMLTPDGVQSFKFAGGKIVDGSHVAGGEEVQEASFDYTMKDLGNDYAGFPSNHSLKHKFLAKIKPEKQQLYKDKMNNMHEFDQLFKLFTVAKQRGDIIEQGVEEARASTASFRQGNAQRAEVNAMSPEEQKAHEDKRAEQQRKRDEARMERERQRNAAKKGVAEEKQRLDPKCWSGYKKQGTKMKGDTRVNNCVKVDEVSQELAVKTLGTRRAYGMDGWGNDEQHEKADRTEKRVQKKFGQSAVDKANKLTDKLVYGDFSDVKEGQGDFSKAIDNLHGWYEVNSSNPDIKEFEFDDREGGHYAQGTVKYSMSTGRVKIEFEDRSGQYGEEDINQTFNSIGDAMNVLRTITTQYRYNNGKAQKFDRLSNREPVTPDKLRKTDRTGRKGTISGAHSNDLKYSIQNNKGKLGPKGVLPEGEIAEDKLAQDLYKDLQIFKKGADKDIGSKAKDKEIGNKPKDKDIVAKEGIVDTIGKKAKQFSRYMTEPQSPHNDQVRSRAKNIAKIRKQEEKKSVFEKDPEAMREFERSGGYKAGIDVMGWQVGWIAAKHAQGDTMKEAFQKLYYGGGSSFPFSQKAFKLAWVAYNKHYGPQGNLEEMDGDSAGRDGSNRKSHSTYGSRDKHTVSNGPDVHLGSGSMMTSQQAQDKALDTLKKVLSKPENMNVLKRLKNK